MSKVIKPLYIMFFLLLLSSAAFAHTLYVSVENNEDGTALATGMFSTGATAAGLEFRLETKEGKVLLKDKMDEFGEYTFKIPDSKEYFVIIDGGPGHVAKEKGPVKKQ